MRSGGIFFRSIRVVRDEPSPAGEDDCPWGDHFVVTLSCAIISRKEAGENVCGLNRCMSGLWGVLAVTLIIPGFIFRLRHGFDFNRGVFSI